MYMHNAGMAKTLPRSLEVERVQTGVKLEKRLLKVLKGIAEYHDMTLGDLLEGIVLHAFEGKAAFGKETLARIAQLRAVYGLDLRAADSHRLVEHPGHD
jgi:hypothetical protein